MWRWYCAVMLLMALTTGRADASLLAVNISGVTTSGSSVDGSSIPVGTPFAIHGTFDPSFPNNSEPGLAIYALSSATADVGGKTYMIDTSAAQLFANLFDPSNTFFPRFYVADLQSELTSTVFAPEFTTATPPINALAPIPTVFSGYAGTGQSFSDLRVPLVSPDISIELVYDPNVGVAASLTAVPEPASLILLSIGTTSLVGFAWRRRKQVQ
jgi:hypothetical protein